MRRLTVRRRLRPRGLSLVEIMVGLAIAALLMVTASPIFGEFIANSKLREGGNLLLSEALAAQSEAVKRNGVVRLATNGATVEVIDRSGAGDPVVLRRTSLNDGVVAASVNLDFGSEGRPVPFGSTGAVNVWISGKPCSTHVRCPGLRVDAGGAARLCPDQLNGCD